MEDGPAADETLRVAEDVGADLIVLGTHGRTGLRRLLTGSVAEAVLRRAPCPVLAWHVPAEHAARAGGIKVILHPTDLSKESSDALRVARALAHDLGARLKLLYVESVDVLAGVPLDVPTELKDDQQALTEMQAKVEGSDLEYPVETQCEQGDPATEIVRVAEQSDCDLIVLGSRGRSGLSRVLLGSVAESVLRRASCPALIVKTPHHEPSESPARSKSSIVL